MPKPKKEKITSNLRNVAQQILNLVADTSPAGRITTQKIFSSAHKIYTSKHKSPFLWWLYRYSSQRQDEIEDSMEELIHAKSMFLCKQRLCNFIYRGNMTTSSANFYLLKELLAHLPNYDTEKDVELLHILPRLRDLIIDLVQEEDALMLSELQERNRSIEQLEEEAERVDSAARKIVILDGNKASISGSDLEDNKEYFFIKQTEGHWRIEWLNPYGKKINVALPSEMIAENSHLSFAELVEDEDSLHAFKLALATWIACEKKFTKIKFSNDNTPLHPNNVFVVNTNEQSIIWYNSVGKPLAIAMDNYPLLESFMRTNPNWDKTSTVDRLTVLLMGVNTRSQISHAERSIKNQAIFKEKISCFILDSTKDIAPFQRVDGVYFLVKSHDLWQLNICQSSELIPLVDGIWDAFYAEIEPYQSLSAADVNKHHKTNILEIVNNLAQDYASFRYPCSVLPEFTPERVLNSLGNSVVLSPKPKGWEVFFVRGDHSVQTIALSQLPEKAQSILQDWPCEQAHGGDYKRQHAFTAAMNAFTPPSKTIHKLQGDFSAIEASLQGQLARLDVRTEKSPAFDNIKNKALKPANKLDLAQFSNVTEMLKTKYKTATTADRLTNNPEKNAPPQATSHGTKLDLSRFSAISELFQAREESSDADIQAESCEKMPGKISVPPTIHSFFGITANSDDASTACTEASFSFRRLRE